MALDVLVSPGCAPLSDEFLERTRKPGDITIDVGEIFKSLTGSAEIPSTNVPALKLALGLRATAIRFARENNLNGVVRTGNGDRDAIRRLQEQAGPAAQVKVLQLDRDTACARVDELMQGADRRVACREGLDRFYLRYVPDPSDVEVS